MTSVSNEANSDGRGLTSPGFYKKPSRWINVLWIVTGFCLFLTFATFPPCYKGDVTEACEADPSLAFILSHAHQQDLQFGKQHAYTYGPLGFLSFLHYPSGTARIQIFAHSILGITVAAGLCLVAQRLGWLRGGMLLVTFAWAASNLHPRMDFVLNTGLLCWGLLCFKENGRRLVLAAAAFVFLAAFSALAKNSFLVVGGGSVLLIAAGLILRGKRWGGFSFVTAFLLLFALGWWIAGQGFNGLRDFLQNAVAMIRGYSGALGWEANTPGGGVGVALAFVWTAVLVAQCLSARGSGGLRLQWLLLAWLGGLFFAAWKHGYVRAHPMNLEMFIGFGAVLTLSLGTLETRNSKLQEWISRTALASWLGGVLCLQWFFFPSIDRSLLEPAHSARAHLVYLLSPAYYERDMETALEGNRQQAQLPQIRAEIGQGSVDVFGRKQAYAFYNSLNFQPRPVPQSYAACNRQLMSLNADHFKSPLAPDFVLFELESFDRKLPAMEDAWALRHLLINYEPVAAEHPFLALRKKRNEPAGLMLSRKGSVQARELINLHGLGSDLIWLEIDLKPTLLGRFREMLLRPPTVRISVWDAEGKKILMRRRAPANMLSAGFVGKPLLLRTEDVFAAYGYGMAERRSTAGYSIELDPGDAPYWHKEIAYRVYQITNTLADSISVDARHFIQNFQEHEENPWNLTREKFGSQVEDSPFVLFRSSRWRASQPLPGNPEENLTFLFLVTLPLLMGLALVVFFKQRRQARTGAGWGDLVLGNLLVLGCLGSLILLTGEIYFRFCYDTTDSLGYTLVCERWVQRHWRVNGAGCRDNVEYHPRISEGQRRLTFLGDSFTAGHGIKNVEDRFPNRLRQMKVGWDVHALANVGLDTASERVLLTRALKQGYKMDEVLLVYCLNDLAVVSGGEPAKLDVGGQGLAVENRGWLLRNSYFINFAYYRYRAAINPQLKDYFPGLIKSYEGTAWERQADELRQLRDLVEGHGGRLSVAIFPFLHVLGKNYEYQVAHDKVAGLCQELNMPYLDLLPVYRDMPARSVTVNPFDAHPNELANQLAADEIANFMSHLPPR